MPQLITSKKVKLLKTAFKHLNSVILYIKSPINKIHWQNPNDLDDENEHFKQPHIAIEQGKYFSILHEATWDNYFNVKCLLKSNVARVVLVTNCIEFA